MKHEVSILVPKEEYDSIPFYLSHPLQPCHRPRADQKAYFLSENSKTMKLIQSLVYLPDDRIFKWSATR